jgi:integrase
MKPITKSPSYLIRNPHSYCFRLVVPPDLQRLVGKTELRYSLKTGYLGRAKNKARFLAGQVQFIFNSLRKGDSVLSTLSNDQIQGLVHQYVKHAIESWDKVPSEDDPHRPFNDANSFRDYIAFLDDIRNDLITSLNLGDFSMLEESIENMLQDNSLLDIEKDSQEYRKLCAEIHKAQIQLMPMQQKHLMCDFSYKEDLPKQFPDVFPKPVDDAPGVKEQTSEKLAAVVDAYWKEKSDDWRPRSKVQYKGIEGWLLETLGNDTLIHTVGYQTGREVKELLMSKKNQRGEPLSKSRVTLYINHISAIWNWAKKNYRDQVEINPFEGLQPSDKKKRADELRDAFTGDDLQKIFVSSKEFGQDRWGRAHHPHFFYIPLIALYTGCRLEEICQLYVEDVQQFGHVWCLDINESRPDQSVKKGERRIVPLHPFIWKEIDFIGYIKNLKDQKGRVFPELKRINNRYGHSFGQWFGRLKKRNGITGNKSFHSFRHTVVTTLFEKDVPDNQISMLVGHITSGQTGGRYGKRFKPKMLFEKAVNKLEYGIDLTHLKKSKFVPG